MTELKKMFPSLTTFSDLDWDAVTTEYESGSIDLTFPEYLQQKAQEGDCPPYLFEIAYYEMAVFNAKTSTALFPFNSGVHLNPTALFLDLEFDVPEMLKVAERGKIEVLERPHILCLYRDGRDQVNALELDETGLSLLQHLENGPMSNKNFVEPRFLTNYQLLVEKGLILELP